MLLNLKEKVWIWDGLSPWYFITIPEKESKKIRKKFRHIHRGWGSIPVKVKIGKSKWKTSIFWEKKGTYILPIKKETRKNENLVNGSVTKLQISIEELL